MHDVKLSEVRGRQATDKQRKNSGSISASLREESELWSKQDKRELARFFEILDQINEREKLC